MKNITKNVLVELEKAREPIPYEGELSNHPFAQIISSYLSEAHGITGQESGRKAPGEEIWAFKAESLSVFYRLYRDSHGEVFYHLECAFGLIPIACEDHIAVELIKRQQNHFFPFLFSINSESLAIIVCRSFTSGTTLSHFLLRLDTIVSFAAQVQEELLKPGFGLLPLPKRCFRKLAS